MIKQYII